MSSYPRLPTTFDSASALFLSPSPNGGGGGGGRSLLEHFLNPPLSYSTIQSPGESQQVFPEVSWDLLSVSGLVLKKVTCNTVQNQTVYKNMH